MLMADQGVSMPAPAFPMKDSSAGASMPVLVFTCCLDKKPARRLRVTYHRFAAEAIIRPAMTLPFHRYPA